jgi:EAL domain-containing protein (putative c-di-GMP-specific phosphodiesterase class I)
VTGVEALLRWQRPEAGLVSPAEFIPVLEETGLIVPVGKWVLRRACAEVREWNEKGWPPLRVAVNLSAHQFRDPGLFDDIESALRESQLPAESLEIEITESAVMGDAESAAETLRRLRERGVAVSIDDFGTGFSSLAALKRFPLHALKIDRAFVRDVADNPADAEIVRVIIGLARCLKLVVIAEGVESEAQCSFLLSSGCDVVQGFLFSAPKPLTILKERIGPNGVWRHAAAETSKTEAA